MAKIISTNMATIPIIFNKQTKKKENDVFYLISVYYGYAVNFLKVDLQTNPTMKLYNF